MRMLRERLGARADLEFKELSVGGLRLVEEMLGYDKVLIVDSMESRNKKTGKIREFSPDRFKEPEQTVAPHVTSFATALELYKRLEPSEVPNTIRIFTIDIEPKLRFSEEMTEPVREAATKLIDQIADEIQLDQNQSK